MTPQLRLSRFLLISSYAAGLLGIGVFQLELFLQLTPLNLLLSFGILLWNAEPKDLRLAVFVVLAWAIGFFSEVLGVATGQIFGKYAYGWVFGWKLWETPLLIGVNWAMIVFVSCDAANRMLPYGWHPALRIAVTALVPVLVDVLIEPVAISTGMWHWYGQMPPLQNYIGWYVVSLLICSVYHITIGVYQKNPVGPLLLFLQIAFFFFMQFL
jgi:putative membrane protein